MFADGNNNESRGRYGTGYMLGLTLFPFVLGLVVVLVLDLPGGIEEENEDDLWNTDVS
jgi:hypothetical protein